MKKLVIALAIMAMAAIAQEQTFKFPGWNCKDVTLLQEQLALAPDNYFKIVLTYHLDFAQNGAPVTFTEACTRIEAAIDAVKPDYSAGGRLSLKKQYALCTNQWMIEVWRYCKANPCSYDQWFLYYRTPAQLGETPDSYYEAVYQTLVVGINNPVQAGRAIKAYCTQLPKSSLPRPERFAKLQMLNDIYTGKLIEDKAAWGDVIAQIRTVMELYK